MRAAGAGREAEFAAVGAGLDAQLALGGVLPEGGAVGVGEGESILRSTPQEQRGGGDAFAGGDETGGGVGDLRGTGAAELLDAFVDEVEAVDVGLAEPAAPGVEGQQPADLQGAPSVNAPPSPRPQKPYPSSDSGMRAVNAS